MCSIVQIVLQIHSEILLMLKDYYFTFRTRTPLYILVRKHFKLLISLSMALHNGYLHFLWHYQS